MELARKQHPGSIQARIRTVATIGFAIYGVYKLGEWAIDAIRENRKRKDNMLSSTADVGDSVPPSNPSLSRETRTKLQRHRRVACAKESLGLIQRMSPSLRDAVAGATSIASERQALKRLRGEPSELQQEYWVVIQNKTFTRLFMTIYVESILSVVVFLHVHFVASMQLPSSQSSAIFMKLFNTLESFVTEDMEEEVRGAVLVEMERTDWNMTTTSDAALHMTYAKLKAGLDGCLQHMKDSSNGALRDQYVNLLDEEVRSAEDSNGADLLDLFAELLDLFESPLAKEAMTETFNALYTENALSNIQPLFSGRGEMPLAQVVAKLSKAAFALDKDRLVSLGSIKQIGQVLFPEEP